jgi:hypothetical protein
VKLSISLLIALTLAISSAARTYAANSTAMMMSAEAAADGADDHARAAAAIAAGGTASSGAGGGGAISRASLFDTETTRALPFAISAFSMFSGPGLQSISANAPTAQQPYTGITARHEVKLDYSVNNRVTLSPTMDVSENFYNSAGQNQLTLNDPSLRVAIADVNYAKWGKTTFDSSVWFSTYAPVSAQSQQLHEYTAFSLAYLPKLHIRGSRFFLSGVTEAKVNLMNNQAQTGLIAPLNLIGGVQGNYRISSWATVFVMDHVMGNVGPNMGQIQLATPLGQANVRRKAQTQSQGQSPVIDGVMIGTMFQVHQGIGLSPRLDWSVNQPIGTTTVGLNCAFNII